jgi:hypothetical protein
MVEILGVARSGGACILLVDDDEDATELMMLGYP